MIVIIIIIISRPPLNEVHGTIQNMSIKYMTVKYAITTSFSFLHCALAVAQCIVIGPVYL